jgi:hypothetical protein
MVNIDKGFLFVFMLNVSFLFIFWLLDINQITVNINRGLAVVFGCLLFGDFFYTYYQEKKELTNSQEQN